MWCVSARGPKTSTCQHVVSHNFQFMLADESKQTERLGSKEQLAEQADQSGGSTEQVGEQAEWAKEAEHPSGSEASVPRTVPTIPTAHPLSASLVRFGILTQV